LIPYLYLVYIATSPSAASPREFRTERYATQIVIADTGVNLPTAARKTKVKTVIGADRRGASATLPPSTCRESLASFAATLRNFLRDCTERSFQRKGKTHLPSPSLMQYSIYPFAHIMAAVIWSAARSFWRWFLSPPSGSRNSAPSRFP
jgi:hypothetical protein